MEHNSNKKINTDSEIPRQDKPKLGLPITALALNVIPYIIFVIEQNVFLLILIGFLPIIGVILGVIALCLGKKRIGKLGVILSIIAVIWPIIFIVTIMLFDYTGSQIATM